MEGPVPALGTRHPHCICFLVHLQVHLGKYTILILLIGVVLLWTHDRSRRTVCIPGLVHGYAGQLSALNTKQSVTFFLDVQVNSANLRGPGSSENQYVAFIQLPSWKVTTRIGYQ